MKYYISGMPEGMEFVGFFFTFYADNFKHIKV